MVLKENEDLSFTPELYNFNIDIQQYVFAILPGQEWEKSIHSASCARGRFLHPQRSPSQVQSRRQVQQGKDLMQRKVRTSPHTMRRTQVLISQLSSSTHLYQTHHQLSTSFFKISLLFPPMTLTKEWNSSSVILLTLPISSESMNL